MKWFLNLPYSIVGLVVFAVAGIAAIGLTYKYKIEPGIPVWAEGETAVQWPLNELPLQVHCESNARSCKAAVNLWRDYTCDGLMEYTDDPATANILVVDGDANDPERGDSVEKAFAVKVGVQVKRIEIRIYDPMMAPYPVLAHALSHGLGLSHTRAGITRSIQKTDFFGESKDPPPRPLDKHSRALKKRYCGRR